MGQIFCSRGRPPENSRGRPVDSTGRPVNSTGRPLEFSRGRPLEQKIWPNMTLQKIKLPYSWVKVGTILDYLFAKYEGFLKNFFLKNHVNIHLSKSYTIT